MSPDPRMLLVLALAAAPGCFKDAGLGASGPATSETSRGDETTGEATTTGAASTCETGCGGPVCGDGMAAFPEECDDGNDDDSDACTSACTLARCGDGHVQAGEQCDAGAGNADDAGCTRACNSAVCGDGLVQAGVEACDDGNMQDGDGCVGCQVVTCGNGELDAGEECDDGNMNEGDGCFADCTLDRCGNGVVDADEECDDGNLDAGDTCSPTCVRKAFVVFVTSEVYPGGLGGLAGADAICNELASAAGLIGAGNYRAWLSTVRVAAQERLYHSPVPYVVTSGDVVASDWNQLTQGMLQSPIAFTETGALLEPTEGGCSGDGLVWTNTNPNGTSKGADCKGWDVFEPFQTGNVGFWYETSGDWTEACQVTCLAPARLYCFEQPAG